MKNFKINEIYCDKKEGLIQITGIEEAKYGNYCYYKRLSNKRNDEFETNSVFAHELTRITIKNPKLMEILYG